MGGFGFLGIVFIMFILLIPFGIYSAQKWAYKCYIELQKLNKNFDRYYTK